MSTNKNKKNVAAEALLEVENIKKAIKEESKNTISALLKEEVKNYLREAIDDEEDYEIQGDEEQAPADDIDANDNESQEAEAQEDDAEFSFDGEDNAESEGDNAEGDTEVPEDETENEPEGSEEGLELDQFKVDGEDDTYDLTGVKDYDQIVKVYKRLNNDDQVLVKHEGNKVSIEDKEADTEYVIDLGGEDEDFAEAEPMAECNNKPQMNENKKRKEMKKNKELVFEVDLGYTDNYQKEDPIKGLSNNEPAPNGAKTLDQGIPTGTEKPWAKDAQSKSAPYGKKELDEVDGADVEPIMGDEESPAGVEECNLEEGGARTSQKKTKRVKSASNAGNPQVGPMRSPNSDNGKLEEAKKYKAMTESLLSKTEAVLNENKELRNTVEKVKKALQEALIVNMNLGKVTKLFMENTTTQKEKVDIINRFNEVKTIEQSNTLYESINRELKKGAQQTLPIQETSMTVDGSKKINETKLYESQDLLDVKNFMKRMANC